MSADVIREIFALLNCFCGGLIFLGLIVYLLRNRQHRVAVAVIALIVLFACLFNSLFLYFLA